VISLLAAHRDGSELAVVPPHLPPGLPVGARVAGWVDLGRARRAVDVQDGPGGRLSSSRPIPRTMDAEILVRHHGVAVGELAAKGPYVAGLVSEVDDVHTVKLTMYIHSRQGQCGK